MLAVLDTNVVVSGLRSSKGAAFAILQLVEAGAVDLAVSAAIVEEYEEVLRRPEQMRAHGLSEAELADVLTLLVSRAVLVEPTERTVLLRDPDDAMFVDATLACDADFLVTHNVRDFAEVGHRVNVVTPAEFLRSLYSS